MLNERERTLDFSDIKPIDNLTLRKALMHQINRLSVEKFNAHEPYNTLIIKLRQIISSVTANLISLMEENRNINNVIRIQVVNTFNERID
jgi:hypothetical protein